MATGPDPISALSSPDPQSISSTVPPPSQIKNPNPTSLPSSISGHPPDLPLQPCPSPFPISKPPPITSSSAVGLAPAPASLRGGRPTAHIADPSSSTAPISNPAYSDGSDPVSVADLAPATLHGSCSTAHPCSTSVPSSFPPLSTSAINIKSPPHTPHSSTNAPVSPPQQSYASFQASDPHLVHPHALNCSSPSSRAAASHKPTYAQAARSGRGSGFVRAHADAINHFARVPRTGAKIICGFREGVPSFSFASSDLPMVEEIYSNTLVMKFSGGRPSLEASQQEIISWGMEKSFSIGPLSSRAFLLRFQEERDLLKVLTRPSSILITFPYKIFRWHNLCHLSEDSSMAPVWISLPRLPMQCFIPEFLESVGNKLGRFLCFDRATTTLARPSVARICVELDLSKPLPQFIWVGLFEGFKQSIIYERLPKFCNHCHRLGHATAVCSKPCTVAPVPADDGHPAMLKERTPPVRNNADHLDRVLPRATSPSKAPPPPSAQSSQNGKQPRPVQLQPPLRHRAEQGQCSGLSSRSSTSPNSSLPESSHGLQLPNDTPILPLPTDSTLVQPPTLAEPQLIPPTKSKSKTRKIRPKKKSVSFKLSGQTNLSANVEFWNEVNNQISNIEQNPTNISNQSIPLNPSAVPLVDDSHPPSMHPNNPNLSTSVPPSKCPSDKLKRKKVTFDTGIIHPQPNVEANTVFWEAVNRQVSILDQARLTGSPAFQSHHSSSRATVPNPPVSIPSSSNTNLSTMSPSTSDSESSIAADSPPYSPTLIPHASQNDVFSLKPSSYKSEGEDSGTEEAHFQGHFSDDMSSAKPKSSRKNKRHPDQPLNVQLRVRKGGGY